MSSFFAFPLAGHRHSCIPSPVFEFHALRHNDGAFLIAPRSVGRRECFPQYNSHNEVQ